MPTPATEKSGFTIRAAVIAVGLSLFLLASSSYIAIKLGALPWPIIFSVIVSGGLVKLVSGKSKVNIHEVNVAQAGASIGGLIAAGIVFTVPGILFLNQTKGYNIDWPNPWMLGLLTALAGLLGVLLSLPLKQTFVDEEKLPYPAGTAGAELLKLGKTGGKQMLTIIMFGCAAGIFALFRDVNYPAGFPLNFLIPLGIHFTIYPLPLAIGSGFILGPRASFSWFGGAIIGWIIIIPILSSQGWAFEEARSWVQNFGMGLALGAGMGFFASYIVPRIKRIVAPFIKSRASYLKLFPTLSALGAIGLVLAGVPFGAAFLAIGGVWVMVTVAARMTGETNINPLEQFGIFVGLVIAFIYDYAGLELSMSASFMIVTFVSVAAAVAGDAGHDYKSAALIGTKFTDIVKVDLIAASFAGFAAPFVMESIRWGFADQLFTDAMPAPQAQLVAGSIFGFDYPQVFLAGFIIAFFAEVGNSFLPNRWKNKVMIMPLGIGLFLGLGLALPIFAGSLIRVYIDKNFRHLYQSGLLIASGVMGGEGIAGFTAGAFKTAGLPPLESAYYLMGFLGILLVITFIKFKQRIAK